MGYEWVFSAPFAEVGQIHPDLPAPEAGEGLPCRVLLAAVRGGGVDQVVGGLGGLVASVVVAT